MVCGCVGRKGERCDGVVFGRGDFRMGEQRMENKYAAEFDQNVACG